MRFAYLCCDFGVPITGTKGASVHVREFTQALRRQGHVVKVFAPGPGADDGNRSPEDFHAVPLEGIAEKILRLLAMEDIAQSGHLIKEWRNLLYSEYLQKILLPIFTTFQPDIIYERHSLFSYAGVELAQRFKVPHLLEVNAPLSLEQAKYRQLVLKHTAEELERAVLNRADALIVVSRALANYARRLGVPPKRITVLPNGVSPERFHPGLSGKEVRSRYNLDGKWVIGFVGTLKPWHDLDTLVAAVRLLANTNGRIHLVIVGEGPRLDHLQALSEGYITCTGAVEHQQVPQFLAAMDVVAIPYSNDGESYFSPLKLYEAMAMAKPVVGARIGQVEEVLVHGETGLLYEPGNAEDLCNKIKEVLEMPDRSASMGAAGRQRVLANHTWDHNARLIVEAAQSQLARGP